MYSPATLQAPRFAGDKGFAEASSALLTLRLLQYESLAANATMPPALRDYVATTAVEIREQICHRALQGVAA